jgi:hypothetical protein
MFTAEFGARSSIVLAPGDPAICPLRNGRPAIGGFDPPESMAVDTSAHLGHEAQDEKVDRQSPAHAIVVG